MISNWSWGSNGPSPFMHGIGGGTVEDFRLSGCRAYSGLLLAILRMIVFCDLKVKNGEI